MAGRKEERKEEGKEDGRERGTTYSHILYEHLYFSQGQIL